MSLLTQWCTCLSQVLEFSSGITVDPGQTVPNIVVQFRANSPDLMYKTFLVLSTNASQLHVPLHVYHGRLSYTLLVSTPEPLFATVLARDPSQTQH